MQLRDFSVNIPMRTAYFVRVPQHAFVRREAGMVRRRHVALQHLCVSPLHSPQHLVPDAHGQEDGFGEHDDARGGVRVAEEDAVGGFGEGGAVGQDELREVDLDGEAVRGGGLLGNVLETDGAAGPGGVEGEVIGEIGKGAEGTG